MDMSDKIYIQPNAHDRWFDGNKPNDNFVEYICKDVLIKWAKEKKAQLLKEAEPTDVTIGIFGGLDLLINKIESL